MFGRLLSLLKGRGGPGRGKEVVVVSGLPRSGTSLMMQMLRAGGMDLLTDGLRTSDEDNPKGYCEFERVKALRDGDAAWLPQAVDKAVKVVSSVLKDLPPAYRYRVIFMERDVTEVLASQAKMLKRRGETKKTDDAEMRQAFEDHLAETDAWLDARGNFQVLKVPYASLIDSPEPIVREVREFLGREMEEQKMAEVVDPDLYRNRA